MKIRRLFILFFMLTAGAQISCSAPIRKETEKPAITPVDSVKNQLPDITLTRMDGSQISAKGLTGVRTILILFQPDCDHCQNEARQIAERLPAFSGYMVYFISGASVKEIDKFSHDFKLSGKPNIHFVSTDAGEIVKSFGNIQAPSIFIYSTEGELVNSFEGEMEIDVVIKYL